jgi:uncharacterized protein (DUF2235 family)
VKKNILIFADGTGNESGILFDERRTNVYKLYRATRSGPDTPIEPSKQIAIYIPGVGTLGALAAPWWKRLWREFIEGAVGGGLTAQIIDCYAAIVNVWEPGDRIYLFGFSRGAYAVRCLAHILEMVGIPQTQADGSALSFEPISLRSIAKVAAKTLYRFGLPKPNWDKVKREVGYFTTNYRCRTDPGESVLPFCIAVWDTVGAIGWLHFASFRFLRLLPFVSSEYDRHFPKNVRFARHAMAIDEYRRDFARVGWGGSKTVSDESIGGVRRFAQVWFAGNHSDIGGSYPENESRLSDITLNWVAEFLTTLPDHESRVIINDALLVRHPSSEGMMHDELMVGHTPAHIHIWGSATERQVYPDGELHASVFERLEMPRVRNFVGYGRYRPRSLIKHPKAQKYFEDDAHQSAGDGSSAVGSVSTRSGPSE